MPRAFNPAAIWRKADGTASPDLGDVGRQITGSRQRPLLANRHALRSDRYWSTPHHDPHRAGQPYHAARSFSRSSSVSLA